MKTKLDIRKKNLILIERIYSSAITTRYHMKKPARKILFGNNFTIVFNFPIKSRLCLCVGGDTLIEATRAKKVFNNNIGANEKVISVLIAHLHGRIHKGQL